MPSPPQRRAARIRTPGEPYVWVTAMGLTVGLTMIAGLLAVVLFKGLEAFWPRRVVEVTLKQSGGPASGNRKVGGEVVLRRQNAGSLGDSTTSPGSNVEWQLHVANKDVYGLGFRYVDADAIETIERPIDVFRWERLEFGPAIGYPVALETEQEGRVVATNAAFIPLLARLVKEAEDRRDEIRRIEKRAIGAINREMSELRIRRRTLERERDAGETVKTALPRITERQVELDSQYADLEARARALRDRQQQGTLEYRLISGEERTMSIGQITHLYAPNQLNGLERTGLFFRRIGLFLSEAPREANTEGGIFPAIFGTFVMTLLMSVAVTPFGVLAAIYLREYATQGPFVRAVRIAVNNLAGVPSIVFGVFGLGFFVYSMGSTIDSVFFADRLPTPTFGTGGILWASLTLALMTVPVVVVATEEALASVSRGAREGSLACGASKWQTIQRIVLPAAAPGILTGLILAMARGAGEVAPLMLVGVVKLAPDLPLDWNHPFVHLDQKFMHLGFHIYDLGFQSPDSEAAKPMVFATTLFLIALVIVLNLSAIVVRNRLRKRFALGAF